jgi:hypothetical protein
VLSIQRVAIDIDMCPAARVTSTPSTGWCITRQPRSSQASSKRRLSAPLGSEESELRS